jgi:hypothetical protein
MKKFALLLMITACALSVAHAAGGLEIKSKSSFAMGQSGRDPFWPIGWKPVGKVDTSSAANEHAGAEVPVTAFVVSSITVEKGAHFAIINGKPMQEGQQFGLQMGTQTYQLTVKAILDGRVVLARRDQEIIVPLRRK